MIKPVRKKRTLRVFLLLALLVVPWPGIFGELRISYVQGARTLLVLPFFFRHPFHLAYTHSIYLAPVEEIFQVTPSAIRLQEIATPSWGVIEYYGTPGVVREAGGEIHLQGITFQVPQLSMRIGFVGKQRLLWKDQTYALHRLAEPGTALTLEPKRISLVAYLWRRVFTCEGFIRPRFAEGSILRAGARADHSGFQKEDNGWPGRREKGPG